MKKLSFTLLLWFIICGYGIFAQGLNPKMVYRGDINNIEKQKGEVSTKTITKIELQILDEDKTPSRNARIYIKELDEMYSCDSLGIFNLDLPQSLKNSDVVHLTIIKRVRINYGQVKIYTRKINIQLNNTLTRKKVILSHSKKVKSYRCTITPSF